jgi:Uncharacterized conserved protein (COG2071)
MMLFTLKNHPFPVEAFFRRSLVLTFAAPREELERLIPECLQLDTFQDRWAFIAVAMVDTTGLRPKGFPCAFGSDFFLIGYRVFVRYTTAAGKRLRGLYILRSETDSRRMEFLGNMFTHYRYSTTDIQLDGDSIRSERSGLAVEISADDKEAHDPGGGGGVPLPAGSPFADWAAARRYAGPLPFTFTYEKSSGKVLIIEGVRENWEPRPVKVDRYRVDFIEQLQLNQVRLANAFVLENIPYYWKKGRTELWRL